jgi:hypothetical protein
MDLTSSGLCTSPQCRASGRPISRAKVRAGRKVFLQNSQAQSVRIDSKLVLLAKIPQEMAHLYTNNSVLPAHLR